jgi:hypothetical protein
MSLLIYMDVHVPLAVTEGLRRRKIDVLTSQEDATAETDDDFLLLRATELDLVAIRLLGLDGPYA